MPSSKSTFFFLAALAVVGPVAMVQPANALQAMGPPPVRRAEHIQLAHKMVRKRSSSPRVVPVRRQEPPESGGAAPSPSPSGSNILDPPLLTESTAATSRTPDPNPPNSRPTTTTTQPPQRPTVTSTSSSSSSSAAIQSSSSTPGARSTTTTVSSSSSTQQASVSSNPPTSTTAISQLTANEASSDPSTSSAIVRVTTTSSASSLPAEQTDKSKDEGASFLPKSALIALIVAAACVVAAVAIWTIIRKWKFGASRQFEDRLEPVNWEPPVTGSGLPMDERDPAAVAIGRGNSVTSQHPRTSFGSSDGTHLGVAGGGAMAGSVAPDFPPQHDFTAGPVHMAPGAGYADLQRGPSPAPSMNYGGYGQQYSTPNPYETYDYNGAYGDNGAYVDNGAYGGYQQPPHNSGPGPHQF